MKSPFLPQLFNTYQFCLTILCCVNLLPIQLFTYRLSTRPCISSLYRNAKFFSDSFVRNISCNIHNVYNIQVVLNSVQLLLYVNFLCTGKLIRCSIIKSSTGSKLYTRTQTTLNTKCVHILHTEYFKLLHSMKSTLLNSVQYTYTMTLHHTVWNSRVKTNSSTVEVWHNFPSPISM